MIDFMKIPGQQLYEIDDDDGVGNSSGEDETAEFQIPKFLDEYLTREGINHGTDNFSSICSIRSPASKMEKVIEAIGVSFNTSFAAGQSHEVKSNNNHRFTVANGAMLPANLSFSEFIPKFRKTYNCHFADEKDHGEIKETHDNDGTGILSRGKYQKKTDDSQKGCRFKVFVYKTEKQSIENCVIQFDVRHNKNTHPIVFRLPLAPIVTRYIYEQVTETPRIDPESVRVN
jgi:hypothetical protein